MLKGTTETTYVLIDHIRRKIPNVYLRFGDGDFNLMDGKADMLAQSSSAISEGYTQLWPLLSPSNMIAVNYHCKELGTLEDGMYPGVHECPKQYAEMCIKRMKSYVTGISTMYSAVALHHVLSMNVPLYDEFLATVRKNGNTILLCNQEFQDDELTRFFGPHKSVRAPARDSFQQSERIIREFDAALTSFDDYIVCILALGCGGRAMTYEFIQSIRRHAKSVLLIDIGSSIDCLMGKMNTRAWVTLTKPITTALLH